MAFQQFTFPQVLADLGLTVRDADLFAGIPSAVVPPEFEASILDWANLASAINTEKARSEFVVAPVLLELRRRHPGKFALFSGVELIADANRGLNGICDFLLARSPSQHIVSAPILTVVEAKNDNIRNGFGQCIASMFAAGMVNESAGMSGAIMYGCVSNGTQWKFLSLAESRVTIDSVECQLHELGKILAILGSIVTSSAK